MAKAHDAADQRGGRQRTSRLVVSLKPEDDDRTYVSKTVSWILRHGAKTVGLKLDNDGWGKVAELMKIEVLDDVAEELLKDVLKDEKRYEMKESPDGQIIRAYSKKERLAEQTPCAFEKGTRVVASSDFSTDSKEPIRVKKGQAGVIYRTKDGDVSVTFENQTKPQWVKAEHISNLQPAPEEDGDNALMKRRERPPRKVGGDSYPRASGLNAGASEFVPPSHVNVNVAGAPPPPPVSAQDAAAQAPYLQAQQMVVMQAQAQQAAMAQYTATATATQAYWNNIYANYAMMNNWQHQAGATAAGATAAQYNAGGGKLTGTIKTYNAEKGFGFIECAHTHQQYNRDVFVHKSQIGDLNRGDAVTFVCEINKSGMPQAKDVALATGGYVQQGQGGANKGQAKGGKDGKGKGKSQRKGKEGKGKGQPKETKETNDAGATADATDKADSSAAEGADKAAEVEASEASK